MRKGNNPGEYPGRVQWNKGAEIEISTVFSENSAGLGYFQQRDGAVDRDPSQDRVDMGKGNGRRRWKGKAINHSTLGRHNQYHIQWHNHPLLMYENFMQCIQSYLINTARC